MKLFKVIASKAGRVVFDDRLDAESPKKAREQMRTLLGLKSLTGVVYAITEIPIELIQSIVDARLTEALARFRDGGVPLSVEEIIRPIIGEEVRSQLPSFREQFATTTPQPVEPVTPARFDAFNSTTGPAGSDAEPHSNGAGISDEVIPEERVTPLATANGVAVDWKAMKKLYLRNRSIKQTAAQFEISPNTVKARCRREGWGK